MQDKKQQFKDKSLIKHYLEGEEKALEILLEQYLKPILNFVYRLVGNTNDAEDITQEVFLKVWKNIKKYHHKSSFKTWIFSIARNTAIDHLRKKKLLIFSDFESEDGPNAISENIASKDDLPAEVLKKAEKKKFLDEALLKLPHDHREVLLLHYVNDLTFKQIGEILKKPLDTVKSRHHRAILALKKILNAPK